MTEPVKLCKDCRHVSELAPKKPGGPVRRFCKRTAYGIGRERSPRSKQGYQQVHCGPEGKLWEPKP